MHRAGASTIQSRRQTPIAASAGHSTSGLPRNTTAAIRSSPILSKRYQTGRIKRRPARPRTHIGVAGDRGRGVVAEDPALRFPDIGNRQSIERHEAREIDDRRHEHEAGGEMIGSKIRPQVRPVPVECVTVGEPRAPALHQADHGDDDDRDGGARIRRSICTRPRGQSSSLRAQT